jgi:hypothetical protein
MRRSGFSAVISHKRATSGHGDGSPDDPRAADTSTDATELAAYEEAPAVESQGSEDAGAATEITSAPDPLDSILRDARSGLDAEASETKTPVEHTTPGTEPSGEARRVIGAGLWDEEPASGETDDDLANTQIIPKLDEEEEDVAPVSLPAVGRGATKDPSSRLVVPAMSEEGASEAPSGQMGDKDLLAELRAVINRKFDDLMK